MLFKSLSTIQNCIIQWVKKKICNQYDSKCIQVVKNYDRSLAFHMLVVLIPWHVLVSFQIVAPEKYDVQGSLQEAAIILTSCTEPKMQVTITLTSPVIREENDRDGGLASHNSLSYSSWYCRCYFPKKSFPVCWFTLRALYCWHATKIFWALKKQPGTLLFHVRNIWLLK